MYLNLSRISDIQINTIIKQFNSDKSYSKKFTFQKTNSQTNWEMVHGGRLISDHFCLVPFPLVKFEHNWDWTQILPQFCLNTNQNTADTANTNFNTTDTWNEPLALTQMKKGQQQMKLCLNSTNHTHSHQAKLVQTITIFGESSGVSARLHQSNVPALFPY